MAAPAPPAIVVDAPGAPPSTAPSSQTPEPTKPKTPTIDTAAAAETSTNRTPISPASKALLNRTNSVAATSPATASCYLCDEQNPGDFSPTTKYLDACLLCSRYFCPIHKSTSFESVCNLNHSTYYHEMLQQARALLEAQSATTPGGTRVLGGRELAEVLIGEGIFPSLGEREKAIFATSPVDERKQRELESFRSLDAAVMNGGVRGEKKEVEVKEAVGADIAI